MTTASTARRSVYFHFVKLSAAILACTLLASCASFVSPRQVDLPLSRLQQGLDSRFPVNKRVLEIFDIELSRPQLALLSESGRVAVSMHARFAPLFMNQSWEGNVAMSGRLTLDAAGTSVVITEARVDRFAVDGVDQMREVQLTKAAGLAVDRLVKDVALYRFRPEELRYLGVQFAPTRIATGSSAVVVTFEPVK